MENFEDVAQDHNERKNRDLQLAFKIAAFLSKWPSTQYIA